jgi:formylglycine-generating enzyme
MRTVALAIVLFSTSLTHANVFNMPPGLTSLETVPVGDAGNVADTRYYSPGDGSVGYAYNIAKYEVTAGQYCEFLNAVAKTDTYDLYNTSMWEDTSYGCKIQRTGSPGSYWYSVASAYANRPVNYVSWADSARFANWLHNGQPTGAQGLATTEDGAYYLNGATSDATLLAVSRESDWKWAVTSQDEWYKAAYYKGGSTNAGYWDYPTSSNSINTGLANYDWSVGHTTDVGSYPTSNSYGAFDQAGNVWEWNDTVLSGVCRGLRGGSFTDYSLDGLYAANHNGSYTPTREFDNLGFRVAHAPEPATLLVLVLGGLAVMRRRR